jgi:hypothetical protein
MMKAIEIKAKTDKNGNLSISEKLKHANKEVRVLILVEDDMDEKSWLKHYLKTLLLIFWQKLKRIFIPPNRGSHLMIKNSVVLVPFPFDDFSAPKTGPKQGEKVDLIFLKPYCFEWSS